MLPEGPPPGIPNRLLPAYHAFRENGPRRLRFLRPAASGRNRRATDYSDGRVQPTWTGIAFPACLSRRALAFEWAGSGRQQSLSHGRILVVFIRMLQGREAVFVQCLEVTSSADQGLGDSRILVVAGRQVQGRMAVIIRRLQVGSGIEQNLDHGRILVPGGRQMQGRAAIIRPKGDPLYWGVKYLTIRHSSASGVRTTAFSLSSVARTSTAVDEGPTESSVPDFGTSHEVIAVVLGVAVFEPRNKVERLFRRKDRFDLLLG